MSPQWCYSDKKFQQFNIQYNIIQYRMSRDQQVLSVFGWFHYCQHGKLSAMTWTNTNWIFRFSFLPSDTLGSVLARWNWMSIWEEKKKLSWWNFHADFLGCQMDFCRPETCPTPGICCKKKDNEETSPDALHYDRHHHNHHRDHPHHHRRRRSKPKKTNRWLTPFISHHLRTGYSEVLSNPELFEN